MLHYQINIIPKWLITGHEMEDNELTDEQVSIWVLTILIFIAGILVNIFD
jgi:hypothetical protein